MRTFSSYGPVDKDLHFHVPRTDHVQAIQNRLIGEPPEKGGHYITVWAPRQRGKTWIMREVLWALETDDRFHAVKLNLEDLQAETDLGRVVSTISRRIARRIEKPAAPPNPDLGPLQQFGEIFLRDRVQKPLILMLDEFDALPEAVISGLVSVFRNLFIQRSEDRADAFHKEYLLHAVALIGVRNVLGVENAKGSPFNVQRSIHIPSLSREEVGSMFQWYHRESGQTVEPAVVDRLFHETLGQPGLVSWFGELLTEGYEGHAPVRSRPIQEGDWERVLQDAVDSLPNNHVLNLIGKADREPYREALLGLFRTGRKTEFSFDDPRLNFLYLNGVIDGERSNGRMVCRFSCPFIQARLFNYFSQRLFHALDEIHDPLADIDAILEAPELDVPALMELYQNYLSKNRHWLLKDAPRRKSDLRIYEAVFHFNLYMYLKRFFLDKGGTVFPEFPTGNGKVDILIRFRDRTCALELKSFQDRHAYTQALKQAAAYGNQLGLERIYLILFIDGIDAENRRTLEAVHKEAESDVRVQPIFIQIGNGAIHPPVEG